MSSSVACIIYDKGKLLIAHRNPTGAMGGRWEFPGGKIDAGETPQEAITREMREEFGVEATAHELIAKTTFFHAKKECKLAAYLVSLSHDGIKTPFTLTEHTEYRWANPEEIPSLEFVDSDLKIYPSVMDFINKIGGTL